MNIGLLTLPLGANYGGILQNFALQKILQKAGHRATTLQLPFPAFDSPKIQAQRELEQQKCGALRRFVQERIALTAPLTYPLAMAQLEPYAFDGFIVGSDQIWRPSFRYRAFLKAMFLDFSFQGKVELKRIAYAASFGQVKWSIPRLLMYRFSLKKLARRFDQISVREGIGAEYCKNLFGINPFVALDPVMLLDGEEYSAALDLPPIAGQSHCLTAYILDPTPAKTAALKKLQDRLGNPECLSFTNYPNCPGEMPSPMEWLDAFRKASFVVTDSFHGTVLSLLFGKPFMTFANISRGVERFVTLLTPFHLEDRLLHLQEGHYNLSDDLLKPLDASQIQETLSPRRQESLKWLLDGLFIP